MLPLNPATARRAVGLVLLLSSIAGSPTSSSAQGRSPSLDDFVDVSSSVVIGHVTARQSAWDAERRRILTQVTLAVDETVVGDEAAQIELVIPGGRVGDVVQEVSDMPEFVEGDESLVFVWTSPGGQRMVVGGAHGKMDIVRDQEGRRLVSGVGALLRAEPGGGPARPDLDSSGNGRASAGPVPLSTVIERIRAVRN